MDDLHDDFASHSERTVLHLNDGESPSEKGHTSSNTGLTPLRMIDPLNEPSKDGKAAERARKAKAAAQAMKVSPSTYSHAPLTPYQGDEHPGDGVGPEKELPPNLRNVPTHLISLASRAMKRVENVVEDERGDYAYSRESKAARDETSMDRQEGGAIFYAEKDGGRLAGMMRDRGISGTTLVGRDGLDELMRLARSGKVRRVIVDELSRVGRRLSLVAAVFEELTALGVELHCVQKGGRITLLEVAIGSYLSAEQLANMTRMMVHARGEMVEQEGRWPAIAPYGYRKVFGEGVKRGTLELHPVESLVVRRVFDELDRGLSIQDVILGLHRDGIEPRGAETWSPSTLRECVANSMHIGTMIWGRFETARDPITRKKRHVLRPVDEWKVHPVPHLAHIPVDLHQRVSGQFFQKKHADRKQPAAYLLHNKICCPGCGRPMGSRTTLTGVMAIQCKGISDVPKTCDNATLYRVEPIERAALGSLASILAEDGLHSRYSEWVERDYQELTAAFEENRVRIRATIDKRRAMIRRSMDPEAMAGFNPADVRRERLVVSEEIERLEEELRALPPVARRSLSADHIGGLRDAFSTVIAETPFRPDDREGREAKFALGELIARVDLKPRLGSRLVDLDVTLNLAADPSDPDGMRAVTTATFDPIALLNRTDSARREAFQNVYNTGERFLTHEQYEVACNALDGWRPSKALLQVPTRLLLDTLLFCQRSGMPYADVPRNSIPARRGDLAAEVKRMVNQGVWLRLATALRAGWPEMEDVPLDPIRRRKPYRRRRRRSEIDKPRMRVIGANGRYTTAIHAIAIECRDRGPLTAAEVVEIGIAFGVEKTGAYRARNTGLDKGFLSVEGRLWSVTDAGRDLVEGLSFVANEPEPA